MWLSERSSDVIAELEARTCHTRSSSRAVAARTAAAGEGEALREATWHLLLEMRGHLRAAGDAHAEGVDTSPTPPPSATKTKKKRPSLPGQAYVEEE